MRVTVCIVGFRNRDDIRRAFDALSISTYVNFDVVICENGGSDAAAALRSGLPEQLPGGQPVQVIDAGGNLGYAGGVNVCMRARPDSDAWWVLNPDTAPAPDALARMIEEMQAHDLDAVGSTIHTSAGIVESQGGRWRAWMGRAESIHHGLTIAEAPDAPLVTPDYLSGASMLVRRSFVDRVGLMREDYFLYAEEVEWCLRGVAAGLRLGVARGALVAHAQGSTTGSVLDMRQRGRMPVYLDERNKVLVTRDRFPARLPVAAVAAFLLIFLRFARRGAWKQVGYALSGWAAGLANRRGPPDWLPTR